VLKPSAPSRIAVSTSAFIRSSSGTVGARSTRPITLVRAQECPAKNPMLGAVRSESMYARSGQGTSPLWSDATIVVIPWNRKFSASGRS